MSDPMNCGLPESFLHRIFYGILPSEPPGKPEVVPKSLYHHFNQYRTHSKVPSFIPAICNLYLFLLLLVNIARKLTSWSTFSKNEMCINFTDFGFLFHLFMLNNLIIFTFFALICFSFSNFLR